MNKINYQPMQQPFPQQVQQPMQQPFPQQPSPQPLPQQIPIQQPPVKPGKNVIWDKVWKNNKLEKANVVAVLFLRKRGVAEPMELIPEKGFFNIDGRAYHERRDCTYLFKKSKSPLVVIKEGQLLPTGTAEWQEKDIQEKCAECQDHVMKGIRHAERVRMGENMGGKKLDGKSIVGIGIAVIVILAFLMNYV